MSICSHCGHIICPKCKNDDLDFDKLKQRFKCKKCKTKFTVSELEENIGRKNLSIISVCE